MSTPGRIRGFPVRFTANITSCWFYDHDVFLTKCAINKQWSWNATAVMRPHRDLICVHKSTSPLLPAENFTPHRQHKTGRARSALSSIKGSDILDISTSRPPDVVPLWSRTVHQSLERARTNQRKRISTAAVRAQTAASSTVTHTATVTRRRQQPHFLCVVGIFHLTAWGFISR